MTTIRKPYDVRDRLPYTSDLPSETVQADKNACDVNLIIKQYDRTGLIAHINEASPSFESLEIRDFKESLDFINSATDAFQALPAVLRKRFNGSPAEYLAFVNSSENRAEAISLGLIAPDPAPADPISVRVVSDDPLPE